MNATDGGSADDFRLDMSGSAHNATQFGSTGDVTVNNYAAASVPARRPPRELPAPARQFVNRRVELDLLDELVREEGDGYAPRLLTVNGADGVGKTSLVSRWAAPLKERFPDGFVYCDISAYRQDGAVNLVEVLGSLLRSLFVPRKDMLPSIEGRSRQWRSATHDLRLLVVLDNIEEPALLNWLLPASPSATVVLISRINAAAFRAEGAHPVNVPPFERDHSRLLLSKVCGDERVNREADAAIGLLDLCRGRPGTVALLGGCIATVETLTMSELLREIAAKPQGRDLAAVIGRRIMLESLEPATRELYRVLRAHPGEDFPVELATALAGTDAGPLLAELSTHELAVATPAGRWRIPDGPGEDPESVRRILDWYLVMARYADRAATSPRRLRLRELDLSTVADPEWNREEQGLDWLEAEIAGLIALQQYAADAGWDADVVAIEESVWVAYLKRPFPGFQEVTSQRAVAAAVRLGDRRWESRMRAQRGRRLSQRGAYDEALEQSLLARQLAEGDDNLAASAAEMTGRVHLARHRNDEAVEMFAHALAMYLRIGNVRGAALTRQFMAQAHLDDGRDDLAGPLLAEALAGFVEEGANPDRGRVLLDIARLDDRLGLVESALSTLDRSQDLLAAAGMHQRLSTALSLRADILIAARRPVEAAAALRHAIEAQERQHNGEGPEASQLRAKLAAL